MDEFPHVTIEHEVLKSSVNFRFNPERCQKAGLKKIPKVDDYSLLQLRRVYHFNKDSCDHIVLTIPNPVLLLIEKGKNFDQTQSELISDPHRTMNVKKNMEENVKNTNEIYYGKDGMIIEKCARAKASRTRDCANDTLRRFDYINRDTKAHSTCSVDENPKENNQIDSVELEMIKIHGEFIVTQEHSYVRRSVDQEEESTCEIAPEKEQIETIEETQESDVEIHQSLYSVEELMAELQDVSLKNCSKELQEPNKINYNVKEPPHKNTILKPNESMSEIHDLNESVTEATHFEDVQQPNGARDSFSDKPVLKLNEQRPKQTKPTEEYYNGKKSIVTHQLSKNLSVNDPTIEKPINLINEIYSNEPMPEVQKSVCVQQKLSQKKTTIQVCDATQEKKEEALINPEVYSNKELISDPINVQSNLNIEEPINIVLLHDELGPIVKLQEPVKILENRHENCNNEEPMFEIEKEPKIVLAKLCDVSQKSSSSDPEPNVSQEVMFKNTIPEESSDGQDTIKVKCLPETLITQETFIATQRDQEEIYVKKAIEEALNGSEIEKTQEKFVKDATIQSPVNQKKKPIEESLSRKPQENFTINNYIQNPMQITEDINLISGKEEAEQILPINPKNLYGKPREHCLVTHNDEVQIDKETLVENKETAVVNIIGSEVEDDRTSIESPWTPEMFLEFSSDEELTQEKIPSNISEVTGDDDNSIVDSGIFIAKKYENEDDKETMGLPAIVEKFDSPQEKFSVENACDDDSLKPSAGIVTPINQEPIKVSETEDEIHQDNRAKDGSEIEDDRTSIESPWTPEMFLEFSSDEFTQDNEESIQLPTDGTITTQEKMPITQDKSSGKNFIPVSKPVENIITQESFEKFAMENYEVLDDDANSEVLTLQETVAEKPIEVVPEKLAAENDTVERDDANFAANPGILTRQKQIDKPIEIAPENYQIERTNANSAANSGILTRQEELNKPIEVVPEKIAKINYEVTSNDANSATNPGILTLQDHVSDKPIEIAPEKFTKENYKIKRDDANSAANPGMLTHQEEMNKPIEVVSEKIAAENYEVTCDDENLATKSGILTNKPIEVVSAENYEIEHDYANFAQNSGILTCQEPIEVASEKSIMENYEVTCDDSNSTTNPGILTRQEHLDKPIEVVSEKLAAENSEVTGDDANSVANPGILTHQEEMNKPIEVVSEKNVAENYDVTCDDANFATKSGIQANVTDKPVEVVSAENYQIEHDYANFPQNSRILPRQQLLEEAYEKFAMENYEVTCDDSNYTTNPGILTRQEHLNKPIEVVSEQLAVENYEVTCNDVNSVANPGILTHQEEIKPIEVLYEKIVAENYEVTCDDANSVANPGILTLHDNVMDKPIEVVPEHFTAENYEVTCEGVNFAPNLGILTLQDNVMDKPIEVLPKKIGAENYDFICDDANLAPNSGIPTLQDNVMDKPIEVLPKKFTVENYEVTYDDANFAPNSGILTLQDKTPDALIFQDDEEILDLSKTPICPGTLSPKPMEVFDEKYCVSETDGSEEDTTQNNFGSTIERSIYSRKRAYSDSDKEPYKSTIYNGTPNTGLKKTKSHSNIEILQVINFSVSGDQYRVFSVEKPMTDAVVSINKPTELELEIADTLVSFTQEERINNNRKSTVIVDYCDIDMEARIFDDELQEVLPQEPYREYACDALEMEMHKIHDEVHQPLQRTVNGELNSKQACIASMQDELIISGFTYDEQVKCTKLKCISFTVTEPKDSLYNDTLQHLSRMYSKAIVDGSVCYKCNECDFHLVKEAHMRVHLRSHISPFWCDVCNEKFGSLTEIKQHMITHRDRPNRKKNGEKTLNKPPRRKAYKCGYCGYVSSFPKRLERHVDMHAQEKLYSCKKCDYVTVTKWIMERHEEEHNKEQHPLECEECGYITMYRELMDTHMHIHNKQTVYKCANCSFSTAHLGYFTAHRAFHEPKTELMSIEERKLHKQQNALQYKCQECEFCTKQQSELLKHARKDHGRMMSIKAFALHCNRQIYMCVKCGFTVQTPGGLKKHMVAHYDIATYMCKVCKFNANSEQELNDHSKMHTQDKPYPCTVCSCKYANIRSLRDHTRKKHSSFNS